MTEIMPVPRILILLSYQQGAIPQLLFEPDIGSRFFSHCAVLQCKCQVPAGSGILYGNEIVQKPSAQFTYAVPCTVFILYLVLL